MSALLPATFRRCALLLALLSGLMPVAAQTPGPGAAPAAATPAAAGTPAAPAANMPPAASALPAPAASSAAAAAAPARPARPARAATAMPAPPKPTCLVAEFRTLALTTHDAVERGTKASEWLTKHSGSCTLAQLSMISANRASWLGTADTVQLMGQMDGILEAKATSSPELMAALYGTKPSPPRKSEDVTSASAQSTTPRPTVVPAPAPAPGAAVTAVVVPGQPLPRGAAPAPVPVPAPAPAVPPGGPAAGGAAPAAPAAAAAPALQKYFNTKVRDSVREFFAQSRGKDVCPPGTIMREMRCEAIIAARKWKFGEPVASDLNLKDVAPALQERLGAPPAGHRFVQLGVDVLLLADDGRVIDAVLDLGQLPPQLAAAQPAKKS